MAVTGCKTVHPFISFCSFISFRLESSNQYSNIGNYCSMPLSWDPHTISLIHIPSPDLHSPVPILTTRRPLPCLQFEAFSSAPKTQYVPDPKSWDLLHGPLWSTSSPPLLLCGDLDSALASWTESSNSFMWFFALGFSYLFQVVFIAIVLDW